MPSYRTIKDGMAFAIAEAAFEGEDVPHPLPDAAKAAAADLIELYEHANGKSVRAMVPDAHEARDLGFWGYKLGFNALVKGQRRHRAPKVSAFEKLPSSVVVPLFKVEFHGDMLEWSGELSDGSPTGWTNAGRRNPEIPSQEEYLGETLGAPRLPIANPERVNRSISSFADGVRDMGADGVEMLWRGIGVATKDGEPLGTFVKMVDEQTVAVRRQDGNIRNSSAAQVYPYEIQRPGPDLQARFASRAKKNPAITALVTNPTARRPLSKDDLELFGAVEGYEDAHGNIVTYERGDGPGAEERTIDGERVKVVRVARKRHARGKPPWLPNPGAYVRVARMPTDDELARAWRYIEHEFTLKEGNVDGEQWAEGLAFGQRYEVDAMDRAVVSEMKPQLTEVQWRQITRRADELLADQGEPLRYKATP